MTQVRVHGKALVELGNKTYLVDAPNGVVITETKPTLRCSGRTTRQMKSAKKDSIFVWCNDHLNSPRTLAKQINRQDLVLHRLSILNDPCSLRGLKVTGVVVDHAAELTLVQAKNLSALRTYVA